MTYRPAVSAPPTGWRLRSVQVTVLTSVALAVGVVITAIVATGIVRFEYRNYPAHLVLDTIAACTALLVAYLVYGRFARRHRLQDFLLMQGLVLLGMVDLGSAFLASTVSEKQSDQLDIWMSVAVRSMGILFISAAAIAGTRLLLPQMWQRMNVIPSAVIFGTLAVVLWSQSMRLPNALHPSLSPSDAGGLFTIGHPVLIGAFLLAVVCFGLSAVTFTMQANGRSDEMLRWLGPACALAMFGRINYVMFPSLYSQWLYSGDVLRTGFYMLLLVGAAREIRQYWNSQVQEAVVEDRRRLARELHDGVVQELGYIRAETHGFGAVDADRTDRIHGACDRALDEARQAVEALGSPLDEPLGFALHRALRQVAERHQMRLEVDLDDSVTADPEQRHALLRIVREAVSNAARHGGAGTARVHLTQDQRGRKVVIEDNGLGFDVVQAQAHARGFGLTSMRERAEGLPGHFEIESDLGNGTTVKVSW